MMCPKTGIVWNSHAKEWDLFSHLRILTIFEWPRIVIAENIPWIIELHRWKWEWKCWPLIDLRHELQIVFQLDCSDKFHRHSISVRAIRLIVDGYVKFLIANQYIEFEYFPGHNGIRMIDHCVVKVFVAFLVLPFVIAPCIANNAIVMETHRHIQNDVVFVTFARS